MYQIYNVNGEAAVLDFRYAVQSSEPRIIRRAREKLIASGNPALEVVKDGVTTIGTAVTFARLADVPTGIDFFVPT